MKAEAVAVEAAGQRYSQVDTFVYLGSTISSVGDVGPEIKRRTGYAWNCFLKYSRAVYDNPYIAVADKVRFLKAEVLEVMLYGCVTWTLSPGDFDKLREAHRGMLLRCLNAYTSTRAAPDYHMLSYLEVLLKTDCECIEATVMKRILHYAGRERRSPPQHRHARQNGRGEEKTGPACETPRTPCHGILHCLRNRPQVLDEGRPRCT